MKVRSPSTHQDSSENSRAENLSAPSPGWFLLENTDTEVAPPESEEDAYMLEAATFYLALRGVGLFLSPKDTELLIGWWESHIPLTTLLRGMHRGAERLQSRNKPVRTLSSLKRSIQVEIRTAQRGRFRPPVTSETSKHFPRETLDHEATPNYDAVDEAIVDQLEFIDRRMAVVRTQEKYEAILATLRQTRTKLVRFKAQHRWPPGGPVSALMTLGLQLYAGLLEGLPSARRESLMTEAQRALCELGDAMSAAAREESLRGIQLALLREEYGILEPSQLLALWEI